MAANDDEEWVELAEAALADALATIEIDREARIVRLDIDGWEHEFETFDDLRAAFVREVEDIDSRASDHGWPHDADTLIDEILFRANVEEMFEELRPRPDKRQMALVFDELLPVSVEAPVRLDVLAVNTELIRYLALHPEQMRRLHPRKFEELVAQLFRDNGWDVVLTPQTRDGGLDFRAFRKEPFGTILTLVECKRYKPERKVGVGVVRSLYGVLGMQNAAHGVVATTSFFTKEAVAEREQVRGRMSLSDFDALCQWLTRYRAR